MILEATIGLEVHVQLSTRSKLFCPCPVAFGVEANVHICPVCAGAPGALPVLNYDAVRRAVALALALGADVHPRSVFSRKHYTYGDLPKGYQITQFDTPLATGGALPTALGPVPLTRLHLEEDAGKLRHDDASALSLIDLNRAGVPLVEVVSAPAMTSSAEAVAFARGLHRLAVHLQICDGILAEGSLRFDANVSLAPPGGPRGARVEIKNLNSFRFLGRALEAEIARQGEILGRGGAVPSETRGFDPDTGRTLPQRGKEGAADYRYMPEPDLGPLALEDPWVQALRGNLPELPWALEVRLARDYGVPADLAELLAGDAPLARAFETAARRCGDGPLAARFVTGPLVGLMKARGEGLGNGETRGAEVGILLGEVVAGRLTLGGAKVALEALLEEGGDPLAIIEARDLARMGDAGALAAIARAVVAEHPEEVALYRGGKGRIAGHLMGQIMARTQGRADPRLAREALMGILDNQEG